MTDTERANAVQEWIDGDEIPCPTCGRPFVPSTAFGWNACHPCMGAARRALALDEDRAYVAGLTLKGLRKVWKENQRMIREYFLYSYICHGLIERKWQVLAPEFAKHGIGFDFDGEEIPLPTISTIESMVVIS